MGTTGRRFGRRRLTLGTSDTPIRGAQSTRISAAAPAVAGGRLPMTQKSTAATGQGSPLTRARPLAGGGAA